MNIRRKNKPYIILHCNHCDNEWKYRGDALFYTSCGKCHYNVRIPKVKKIEDEIEIDKPTIETIEEIPTPTETFELPTPPTPTTPTTLPSNFRNPFLRRIRKEIAQ